jgi:glycosyltransferase involved in cell wall biosynthesis
LVLVDNGSEDRTWEVARSIIDERWGGGVQLYRNEHNAGAYQAMNQAVALARGYFIAVYHADDVYEPTIVEEEVDYLQTHAQAGAVFCLDHYIDDDGRTFGGTTMPAEFQGRELFTYEDVFPYLLRRKNGLFRCPTFMVRSEVWKAVGPFNPERYDIGTDMEMWLRILRRFPVGVLDKRLMRYRHGRRRQSWSNHYNDLRTDPERFFQVMDDYLEADGWRQRVHPNDMVEYAFHRCDDETYRAANFIIRGNPGAARELLGRPYPLETLRVNLRRRKFRVLLLRALMRLGLGLGAVRPLSRLLQWAEGGPRH